MSKRLLSLLAVLILLLGAAPAGGEIVTPAELNGQEIGVQTGTTFDKMVEQMLPDSVVQYFNGKADLVAALTSHKVAAFVTDEPVAEILARENSQITWLPDYLDRYDFAFVFPKNEAGKALRNEFNAFLAQLPEGTLKALEAKWFGDDEDAKTMPDLSGLTGEKGTLRVATEADYMPFEYVRDGAVVGFDMEIAALFCAYAGYGLEIVNMSFDGILPSVQTGKCDFAASGISVTPERAESILFSDPYFSGGTVLVVLKAAGAIPEFTDFAQLKGKRVSMIIGAPFEELVKTKAPDVGSFSYFNTVPDLIMALKSDKTDAFLCNNAVSQLAVSRDPELAIFPGSLQSSHFGFAFQKGDPRVSAWQAARDSIPDADIQAAWNKWTGADEAAKVLPAQDWPGTNGTITVAACDTLEPMSYSGPGGQLVGFDIEVLMMIARELDVHIRFVGMDFSAVLTCVQSGKADIGTGSIIITDERAESVDFVSYYPAAFTLVVRSTRQEDESFWAGIADSFNKTFVREHRWQLFVQGILTTLLITALTILFGTLLGFGVFMLCRNGNPAANLVTRFSIWLVQGMPMVVLLMVLYYIIFGSVAISGILVAVIGFTLTFGAAVYGLLKLGVGAVDRGQYEAACALGYSDRRTFFRIILPQALPHVLPSYRGEIVSLIKATAIVGYIAVQDLTKMGDIVRSRTYEAFFPLIAITIIYFALEALFGFLISRIGVRFDPRRRKPADILKGVKTDD
ncbi:MAG: transporter substrate-binding domain-containing protein [Clostridia bacterium]|nr:transporter substrate-binding domain-containing protein [Clostridia bacterium]